MRPKSLAIELLGWLWFGGSAAESSYHPPVQWAEAGNRVVAETLARDAPCMVARLGSTELSVIAYYLRWRRGRRVRLAYPGTLKRNIWINSGVFPGDDAMLDEFCELYLDSIREADVMAVWFQRGEHRVVAQASTRPRLIELTALVGMLYESPWSAELAGRRVLVVHPFATSIESQYRQHRAELFDNPLVLPEFELQTLTPPQTIAGNTQGYSNWFEALSVLRDALSAREYDVVLIGAGAYGLPIAAFAKQQGKQAVHIGGATQLFFGIKGRRWEVESEDVAELFNPHWVRASDEEAPQGAELVENGCYW